MRMAAKRQARLNEQTGNFFDENTKKCKLGLIQKFLDCPEDNNCTFLGFLNIGSFWKETQL